jgi:cytochrome c oxidase subunit 2
VLIFVIRFVGFIIVSIIKNSFVNKNLLEIQIVERVWTLIPAVILIQIALPSLLLLYMLDESIDSTLTLKAIGHQ